MMQKNIYYFGFISSIILTIITLITFGFGITAVPISGEFCTGDCIEYPYLETIKQFPKDYLWMFFAVFLVITYVIFMVSIHSIAPAERKIYSLIGLAFAIMTGVILLSNFFIQFSVVPASLMNAETEGIPLITQYNSHGVFIALEELGYILMGISFLFIAQVFKGKNPLQASIRWIFIVAFILVIVSFIIVSIISGIVRMDRFEIIVISINWLTLIVNGFLTGIFFRRQLKEVS